MKRLSTILSLFLFSSFIAFSQSVDHHYTVDKNKIQDGYVVEKIWLQNYAKPIVSVFQPDFQTIDNFPESVSPNSVNNVEVIIGLERKRPFAFVQIPVYSIDEQSKLPRQLTSFSLKVEETPASVVSVAKAKTTADGSVLKSGGWYKIAVSENGIYKIDYDFLQSKLGIDPSAINPAHIRLFGNGGVMHSEDNMAVRPDDLVENAIVVVDGGNNKFDQGDYILFYANGPLGWAKDSINKTFYHVKHLYEDKSYYFLNFDQEPGLRISGIPGPSNPNVTVTSFDDHLVHDEDLVSVGRIGKKWFGEDFSTDPGKQSTRTFSFPTGSLSADTVIMRLEVGARSSANGIFAVSVNGQSAGNYAIFAAVGDNPVTSQAISLRRPVTGGSASLQLTYSPGVSTGKGYLNYIELLTRRQLSFSDGIMTFRDWSSVGPSNIATYKIQNANSSLAVWDVTDPLQPVRINGSLSGSEYSFTQYASSLHEYVAFDGNQYKSAEFIKKVDNQNLHGSHQVDYIIVTHPDFLDAANKLADFHRQKSSMRVIVATTDQVYNEFGSGSQDIGAIRDFARMFYQRAGLDTNQMPRYLLLFGDASFDYKDRVANNQNFVPTFETAESGNNITGYCTDDYFAFLDDNENIEGGVINTMDLAVGRLPVTTLSSANYVVDKIIRYGSPASLGPWRVSTTILSDNGDDNIHFKDGEKMASTINGHTNLYNETKVYLAAIPTVSTPGGERAPDANKMINDQVFKGTFLINYNGHGSITTLAHERILTQDDFNGWKNGEKLPIMVTATCDFTKFDDPAYISAGEMLMLKPNGGAIALLTTTQLVYQYENRILNMAFLDAFFRKYSGIWPTFGDAFRYSKNATYSKNSGDLSNFRKFILLGDPALTPAFPRHEIYTDAISDGNTSLPVDTMKALGKYKISGSVRGINGQSLTDFNGRIYVTIYDKARSAKTITGPVEEFAVQNNIIYKGKATVTNGLFSFTFITPKDLNYDMGKGKISYYAENGETDAAGADTMLTIGGFSDVVIDDDAAPIIKAFIGDSLFRDGGITGANSLLYVQLFDKIGINVSGNSIGHDLTGVLDGDIQHPFTLNDYYETAPNDYTRGYVYFPLSGLTEGKHSIKVKGWDMKNNSGEGTVNFEVVNGDVVKVQNLMNYPNPFSDKTHFVFEHNHPDEDLKAQINIYSTSGYKVRTIEQTFLAEGSRSIEVTWDGTDNNGAKLPSGIYVYRINIATDKGIQATAYQKLVLIR